MVTWSLPSRKDLKLIYKYIAQDSAYYARKVIKNIVTRAMGLSAFPEIGRVVPEIGDSKIREIFVYSYRIIYQVSANEVEILTVIHGKRDFKPEDL